MRSLVEEPPNGHDIDCMKRAIEAGARGDAEASLISELAGRVVVESTHRFVLQGLVEQGDQAPDWAYSRWCADLAYRSMLLAADPRTDLAVEYVLGALYPDSLARVLDGEVELRVLGTTVAAGDYLVADLALFEFGGLADFIAERAEAGLLDRTDRVRDWAYAEMRAYEFVDFRGCRLVLRDLVTGDELEALNIGAMSEASDDGIIGRLVPISSEPGLMFAARPIFVDLDTAKTVAEAVRTPEPLAWLDALSSALEGDRWEEGFHRTDSTPFTSDLPMRTPVVDEPAHAGEEAGRITDLRAKGYSAEVANALAVLEVGLIAAQVSDRGAAVVGPHVVAALGVPGAFAAAEIECTRAETAHAWKALAAVAPDHISERCRALAQRAESARGSAFFRRERTDAGS